MLKYLPSPNTCAFVPRSEVPFPLPDGTALTSSMPLKTSLLSNAWGHSWY